MLLGTQFHIPFLKPDFICVCESSPHTPHGQTVCTGLSLACGDSALINCNGISQTRRRRRNRRKKEEMSYLCHISQCLSGRLQYPDWKCIRLSSTAEKERRRELRRGLHLGSISRVILCSIEKDTMQQLYRKYYDTVALHTGYSVSEKYLIAI